MTAPTIEEIIAEIKQNGCKNGAFIVASLEKLQSIEPQPVPVEPDSVSRARKYGHDHLITEEARDYIDSLQSALQLAQEELRTDWYLQAKRSDEMAKAWEREARELKERAEQAEKDRDICYISLQDMRRRLHEIASLVTDPRLDEKHTA